MSSIVLTMIGAPESTLLPGGLESVVRVFEPARGQLMFSVFLFDGVLKDTTSRRYDMLTSTVSSSERGLEFRWDELVGLAEDTFDVWDLLLAGYPKQARPPGRGTFEELAARSEVTVEIFDSHSLRLATRSDALAQRALAAFPALRASPADSQ